MIWQLIRRDVAWRWMPWLFLAGVTACAFWDFSGGAKDFVGLAIAYCVFSLTPAYAFNRQARDVFFQAPLPITVRQIYLSRVVSMLALFWLTVGTGLAFGQALSHPAFTRTLLDFGSVFMTALMAIQSATVQCKLRKSGIYIFNLFWLAGVGACGISGLPAWLLRQGAITEFAFPAICWVISAGIFLGTWQALPKSFDFAPRMLPAHKQGKARSRWQLVFASTYLLHPFWLACYFGCGLLWASKWFAAGWFVVWILLIVGWRLMQWNLRWILAFPVSPRILLAAILLPSLLAVCGGYEAGLHIEALADMHDRGIMVTADSDTVLTNISKDCRMFDVLPPDDYLVPARHDKVPLIRAPWGETFQPGTNSIDGFNVYNPYASGCDNSERFLDWEFMRATTAVYGRAIPRDRNAGPYLVTSPAGIPGLRKQLVTICLIAAYMMLMIALSSLEDWYRLQPLAPKLRLTIVILTSLPGVVTFIYFKDVSQWFFLGSSRKSDRRDCHRDSDTGRNSSDSRCNVSPDGVRQQNGAEAFMIWQLMRRDPACRMTLWLTPGVTVICALSHFFAPAEADGDPSILLVLAIFALLFAGLVAVFTQSSDTDFQATLPATVRQIFLSRMLSMAAMMLLPVIAGLAMLRAVKDSVTADVPLEAWTLFTCTLLGIQCFAIRRNIPQWLIIILLPAWLFICAVAGIGDLLNIGSGAAVATRLACRAIIVAVVWRTWQVLPASFQDASMEMAKALPARPEIADRTPGAPSWKTWISIALLPSCWGFIQGLVVVLLGASNPIVLVLLGFQWPAIRTQFRWLSALPVSPRILICAGALPTLLAICGGYAVNIRRPWTPAPETRGVSVRHSQESDCRTPNVLPSLEYWIPVRSGSGPLIESPWGETFQPPVNRVMGFDIYNPYAVGCDNSQRFLEWQFSRATFAIYGRSIPLDKKVNPDVKQTAISSFRTQAISIASLIGFSLLSLLVAMTFDWHRMRRLPEAVRVGAKWLVGGAAFALLLWISFSDIDLIQWVSWSLPANTATAIAVEAAVLALLLIAVEKLFRKLEFTDKPPKGAI